MLVGFVCTDSQEYDINFASERVLNHKECAEEFLRKRCKYFNRILNLVDIKTIP